MNKKKLSIAIVGAGMGGLAVAATLRRVGIDVQVYEQAARFARIGAGIQMMPNSMKVLRGIGVEDRLRATCFPALLASRTALGYRRGDARIAHAGESLRRALSVHAPRRPARRARIRRAARDHPSQQEAGRARSGRRAGDARFADGSTRERRCRDRRRRRAFDRARHHGRSRRADPQRAHRLSRGVSVAADGRLRYRAVAHQVVGHRPPHRHLLHHRRRQRNLLRDQRAGARRMDDARIVVGERRRQGIARGVRGVSPGCPQRARRVPGLPQVGDPRARAAAALERRTRRAARRLRVIR